MRGHPPTESISRNSASLERPVVTLSRSNRLGCRPGRSSQAGTLSKELQMLRMTILGLGTFLIFGTADLQAQVDPDQPATAAQDARQDVRPDTRPDTRPDVRPDARPDARPDRRPDVRPDHRPDVRPDRRPDARPTSDRIRRATIDRRRDAAPRRVRPDVRRTRANPR